MLQTNTLLAGAAVVALTLGVTGQIKTIPDRDKPLSKSDIIVVTNDTGPTAETEENAEQSAKMGKEEGEHQGTEVGATSKSETQKIEQPNATTSERAKGADTDAPD
jgi:hypothetical protein